MSEDLVKKYKLEEAVRRFQQINEYSFVTKGNMIDEDGQDDPNAQNGGMPPAGGQPPMGGDPNMGGQDPMGGGGQPPMDGGAPQDGGAMPPMGGDPNMGGQDPMGGMPPADGQQPPMDGGQGQDPMGGMPPMDGGEGMDMDADVEGDDMGEDDGEDVEEIDVDDLTQSQEAEEYKIDGVDKKLTKVLKALEKFDAALDMSNAKIIELEKEIEKRNPTQEEQLNLRSLASYPYSETPDKYWEKQQKEHPNYNIMSNNDVPTSKEQEEFAIRKGDVNNFNEHEISKSFDDDIKLEDFLRF